MIVTLHKVSVRRFDKRNCYKVTGRRIWVDSVDFFRGLSDLQQEIKLKSLNKDLTHKIEYVRIDLKNTEIHPVNISNNNEDANNSDDMSEAFLVRQ